VQFIAPPEVGLALTEMDLSAHAHPEAELERLAAEEVDAPFDLARGPLIRGRLLHLADDDHALLVTMHHIVSDGWSMGVLVHEFSALYAAFSQGLPDPLPPLPIQYADYALWQRRWITGEMLQRQLDFWRHHLSGAPALLELPTDRARPPVQDYRGARLEFEMDAELTAGLRGLSQRHGTTLFMTLLASWAALLARLSGQPDVVIGTPVANRRGAEIEPLIGFFVNTQALRIDLSGSPSVAELLAQVRSTALAAQTHQDIPFEQVVEALSPIRSMAHNPVFQVTFAWQNAPGGSLELPGLQLEPVETSSTTAKFDLELTLHDAGECIAGSLGYACALFDRSTIERHLGHWQTLLRAMVADDCALVARLPLLMPPEQQHLLRTFNDTVAPFPHELCIHQLFEEQADRTPEATAVVFEDASLTYRELNTQANRLAYHLIALGVRPDLLVAIALPRGIDLVVALLATLKAGGAYVPLDPDYPAERLAYMLADSAPRVLVTEARVHAALGELPPSLKVLALDAATRPWETLPAFNPGLRARGLTSTHLAYVIYTSGSTGMPKGVMVGHAQVVRLFEATRAWFDFNAQDVWTLFHSCAFDFSVWELWGALLHGGRLVIVPHLTARSPHEFYNLLCGQQVTVLNQTPSAFRQLIAAQADSDRMHHLRCVIFGGEALMPSTLSPWYALNGERTRLVNMYGITETTVHVTYRPLAPEDTQSSGSPIGVRIPDLRVMLLDAYGQLVPVGVPGELCVGGDGVARGYLNRPDLTAERFVPNPFGEPGSRMYKTGDLGRWRPDGSIQFLGRNDHQVKIRGFRIELGEIEAALRSHPEVREAVVLAREDAPGDKRLVAYVVGEAAPEALRQHLDSRLPKHMVPAAYVTLDALPLTPNGKLDRRALPAPEDEAFGTRAWEAPQGEVESTLARIWSELLGVERIGRHDDFFVLGGHSLLAVQLASRIRAALGLEVPLAELFAQPTLAGYAQRVAAATASALPAIVPASRLEALPLSFAQQRLWFLAQLDERAGAAYAMPGGVRLKGPLDAAALQAAMNRIVARHEALRTCFGSVDGAPVQLIGPPDVGLALSQVDLSEHSEPETELERLATEEASAPFDLAHGPLIRARLIRLADDDHASLVTMHHIVSDGWSMGVLVNEFSALYAAFSQGQPDPLPALPIQYADYAVWQRRWITGEVLQRQLDFWRDHLRGAPALLELPTDRPRPAMQDYEGASLGFELDAELTANLKALSQRHGTTLFMTLLAAWAALLARLSGQSDVVIGTPVANRHCAEIEPLIGFFVNTQALRVDLAGSPTVAELLAQVRSTALAAQEHQDIPFEQVVEALSPVRSMAHSPIFQVMFAWQNAPEGVLDLPGLQLEPMRGSSTTVKFDLALTLQDAGERIAGSCGYACALFDRPSIERYIGHWQTLLGALVANDAARVARLPLLTPSAQQHLLHAFNDTAAPFPQERCVHQLFEEQAACTPEATALVFEDTSLTYGELNAQANRIAHHLIALGVQPDTRVAIALPRGIHMVAAMLATLKAGGAYLPLDPDYPRERLAFMLADSAPRVLVTEARLWAVLADLPTSLSVLSLDDASRPWEATPAANPDPHTLGISPTHLAYVIYTSGSTGRPKGVCVEHRQLLNYLHAVKKRLRLAHGASYASVSTLAADLGHTAIFSALAWGGTLHVISEERIFSGQALAEYFRQHPVDLLKITPSHLAALQDSTGAGQLLPRRWLVLGGEASSQGWAQSLADSQSCEVFNHYGPTETTVGALVFHVGSTPVSTPAVALPLGQPLANCQVFVLDPGLCPVPIGVTGEIHIAGAGVARGYLNGPELTAERFVPDPYTGVPGARMYKTSDLGRWRPDGSIEFLGRNDQQVKVRGFRIELGEIEAALRSHPQVREAAVLAREDVPGDQRLVAYVVGQAVPEALRAHLGSRLPEYMVPAAYVPLDALPLTPNGKLDRRALPAPEADAFGSRAYEAPHSEIETLIARLWGELLGVERIGRHDDFFALGGHSLLAVQLSSRIRAALGLEVPLADLFTQPTLAGFAQRVVAATATTLPAIVPAPREEAPPLSFAQQRLWFLAQLDERAGAAYAIPVGVRLKGSLDTAALHAAMNRIVARHEALRTCFGLVDGAPVQVIAAPEMGLGLSHADLSGHADAEAELERLAAEEASAPFNLAHGPLIRVRVIRLADDDHALLVTMHHIVSDGWSMGVLVNEFSALYAAYTQGRPDALPALPIQYADYAVWQHRWITGEVLQRQLDFWRDHLSDAPTLLELPSDRPRPAVQDYAGEFVDFELDAELTANLKALSQRHGTTLFMTMLAAWAALLARLSGQSDVVIGTPVANRHHAEIEPLIGFFVNTQALRIDLSGSPSVAELLAQVRATALAAQAHQDVPFEQVVEALSPARSMAHSPVFQVMFAWQNAPEGNLQLPGLQPQPVRAHVATIKFDLELSLHDAADRIAGRLGYASSLFERTTVERYLVHWRTLLRALVADDQAIVARLPLLSDDEQHQLLQGFNETAASFPADLCVHELFEAQVERTPEVTALVFEDTSLSYAELNAQANRLAHHLVSLGVQPDTRVAIALPRGIDTVVALLGTLKAGGAYVPLDPDYPAERLAFMLTDSAPCVLITGSRMRAALGDVPHSLAVLALDDMPRACEGWPAANPEARLLGLTSAHLAYIIYTSGSTGMPKGVMVQHRALCHSTTARIACYGAPGSMALTPSFAFDASVGALFWSLCTGSTLVLPAADQASDPQHLRNLVEQHRLQFWLGTPALYEAMLLPMQGTGLESLRGVILGGETPQAALFTRNEQLLCGPTLYGEYGPTEATVWATVTQLRAHQPALIGRPIANARIYIFDAWGQPAPIGVAGEIHIGGTGVARAYLNRPDLTAERFLPDPFAAQPGSRMYKTGDLGRWLADGTIEFLGRNDYQVKVRGFRIELGEIEAALCSHPEVRDVVVVAREDVPGDQRLVAYIVGEAAPEALRTHLGTRLPEYMVPAAYVALDALPLTPNGKLDRAGLPAPEAEAYAARAYEAAHGEIEILLARLWSELLGIERIGRHDDFFALGGHSLLAVQLTSRIRTALGLDVPLSDLFAQPTLAGFAQRVAVATASALPAIVPASRLEALPLSFAQQRLWFLAQLDERAGTAYAIPGGVRLKGSLDRAALRAAMNRILERHEALRTCFTLVDGAPVQVIAAPEMGLALSHADLSGHADAEAELERLASEEANVPFDLACGPLIRGRLIRLADDDHALLVTMHHIVSDGWSMGVLVNEFSALYAAFSQEQPDPLPALPIQYADYAVWQRRWITGEVLQRHLDFWRNHLSGASALLELPTDRPRPAVQDYAGASFGFELDAELTENLKALSQRNGTTLFMTLLASWAALLARLSGQSDVVIGTPVANRHRAEIEPLIGFFVNTQAMRVDLSGSPSVAELLAQVRATALAAQEYQDIPFEQVVEALSPVRSLAHSPVFQVMFAWQNAPEGSLELPGLQLEPVGASSTTVKFDLELTLHDAGDGIAGSLSYACALFDLTSIERHVGHWQTLLRGLVVDDRACVARLPLLTPPERRHLLHVVNHTAAPFPHERCIHQLFEEQAARTPEATALVFEGTSLTYRELNARANRIAHHLIALGVVGGDCVSLALPRCDDLVAAELAVLKCGAAYVPLDLDHPSERLHFMLSDCAARVLVCHSHCSLLGLTRLEVDRLADPGVDTDPQRPVHPQASAYVMYTSGSTGTPKGVVVPHRAVVHFACNLGHAEIINSDRVAFLANPAFDASTFEVWAALLHGAALIVIDTPTLLEPHVLAQRLGETGVSVLHLTAGLLPTYGLVLAPVLAGLRYLLTGGDRVDVAAVARILERSAPQRLLHCYGPTETTTFALTHEVSVTDTQGGALPLGRPIDRARVYVLDAHGAPVPVGVTGEIHVGGAGVAQGYLRRPELTAERFVPDPFGEPGLRLYKTGDLGRWRADGTIEFLGRNDHQVKIRGFRIELGEIEAALCSHPEISVAVVLTRKDSTGDQRLVAYVVGEVAPEVLRQHLGARLPEYMVPAAYVALDELPLTPNGKLDRHALPTPEAQAFGTRAHEAPQGEIEPLLARLWSELLGIERIGRHDNFFALGGHSLLAVQLTSRVRAALGLDVPLADLFTQPTLAGFAQRMAEATASALPAIVPASRPQALPLSFAQQRLWFLAQLDKRAGAAYAMPGGVRLKGSLDTAALHAAMDRIVARHEALRTCFCSVHGDLVQVIAAADAGFALAHMDLSHQAEPQNELERIVAEEVAAPFDLAQGPLLRGRLVRLAHDDHVLLVTMHHIVSDGWSMGVMINEFSALYDAFSQGRPDPLPPLSIQYADYALWQRRWITGEVLQRQLDFWRTHLSGAPALLELPTDRPRPAVQDYAGASIGFELDAELTAHLKALSQRHGTTMFMTLLASWAVLLSRLSCQCDVVIGTPVANRHRAEIEPLIGFFVNTQALRVELSGSPTVAQLLAQVRATALAAQAHQDIPFEQVVEELSPARSMTHSPIFQVMFAWQNAPEGLLELPGLALEHVGASSNTVKFDLELTLHDAGERIAGSLGYACALFDRSSIERHLGHWQTLLRGLVADDAALVTRLPLLTSTERQHLLSAFNDTATPFPQGRCLHQLFEEQAARTPEATALIFEGTSLTYRELNARANRIAHHLIALGVRPDSLVAIALQRGMDMVVAVLAALKAGGAYVPLDPDYPAERLAFMLQDSSPQVLLTAANVYAMLRAFSPALNVLQLDTTAPPWVALPVNNPDPGVLGLTPAHPAYVIYTSGSTGTPKGVMVEHRHIVHSTMCRQRTYGNLGRFLLLSSLSFDSSIAGIFGTLANAGTLVIASTEIARNPDLLQQHIHAHRIQSLLCVPSLYQHLVGDMTDTAHLSTVIVAGEACPAALVRASTEAAPHVNLFNEYGPTECTVWATVHRCEAEPGGITVPIGKPIANTRIYLLDTDGAPVPVGVAGEIHIGGAGVARSYLNRPDLTAERFTPDPYAAQPGARMYKTGDLGRWRIDGTIEFLGRNDEQVKIRGFRIELGEIEAALHSHPEVRAAVVLAREDAPGNKRLVAYVVGEAAPEMLRAHLNSRLPEYMVPAAYVALDALPLTPNGKLDRRTLPAPEAEAFGARAYEAPQGEVENLLALLWGELLGSERIGRHDDFFALGGHSLMAVQLSSRIRTALGLEVPLAELFAQPTLADFAQRVAAATASALPAIVPALRQEALPLSFAQQRLWFLAQLDERVGAAYAIPAGVRLRGPLDVTALYAALNRIVARHETLRTCFGSVEGAPVQLIAAPEVGLALSRLDLSGHSDREAELERLAAEEASAPFDLARGPLTRGRLIRLADEDHVLLVTMHHIVSDGWSMGVLVHEFSALYAAFSQGLPDPLPALPIQYADYALWQRRWITGAVLRRQLDFWRTHLSGAPALLELPTDRPRPPVQDYAGASCGFELDAELTANIKALSQRHGTTLFMTLLAAWAALLARLSGQANVVIGTPMANRHRAEVEPLIGFFVNTQALRVDLSGSPSVAELLTQVRTTALAAQEHQDVPFEQVVEALSPQRSLAHSPVFQVMFAWQNAPGGSLELTGLQLEPVRASSTTVKFDLELTLHDAGECIAGSLSYACALFDHDTVERHIAHWQTLLRALVADDDQTTVARLPLLSREEQRQLLHTFNDTAANFPAELSIHEQFEVQVERTPEATALVCADSSLSYAELNAQANRLAHHLVALGVQPDSRVAIALPRGIDMVVALLATLKAGGAYVPLDPDYPTERLNYMLADSNPRVLLTQARVHAKLASLSPALEVVEIDGPLRPWQHLPATDPAAAAIGLSASHLAYVIYTSGSTGIPKAAQVVHHGLRNLMDWYVHDLGFDADDSVLLATSHSFDLTQKNIFGPLLVGATLHLGTEPFDPARLLQQIRIHSIRCLNVAPSAFHALMDADVEHALSGLRRVMLGGEPIQVHKLLQLREPRPQIVNNYGPTECSDVVAYHCLQEPMQQYAAAGVPLGKPLRNTRLYVLDSCLQPTPVGVFGEICVAGAGVGRGYLNRPDLTAERFVPDPFGEPGSRMYKTGDLGRWRLDGSIEFLGRNDHQMKIRGFRIEPGEIEAALRSHPEVCEAIVLAREDVPGNKRLVAYVVGQAAPEVLRTHLGTRLPEYMVPAAYVALDALPLTPNGKLDRRALPAPDADAFGERPYEAPEGDIEILLARLWSELLGMERVGRHDDFFTLGGHSLLAVQLISRIRTALGLDVPLAELFSQPTLAGFAQRVAAASASAVPAIVPASRQESLQLSFAQQRLWFLAQLDERAGAAYAIPGGVRLKGSLDVAALQAAMNRIVERHESLRTCFGSVDGAPVQLIAPPEVGLPLTQVDLSGHSDAEAEAERLAAEEARAPFDLAHGPLIRGRLVRLADDEHVLLVTMHHIVSDGWSMGVLVNEFSTLYAAFAQGLPDPLPPLPIQYADYAVWQRRWISGEVLQRQLDFWRNHLSGAPALLELPTDRPRPPVQDYAGASFCFELDAELRAKLKVLSQRHGTTLFMTLLATWAALLSRLSNQSDVVIGTPVANRHRAEIEPLIGCFVNTQALRVDLSGSISVAELLAQVRATALAAQAHQDIPFEQVVEALSLERSLAHAPVYQAVFVMQNTPTGHLQLPGLSLRGVSAPTRSAATDLWWSVEETGERLACTVVYARALFDAATIERWSRMWRTLARAMCALDAQPVPQLPVLEPAEHEQLVHGFNATTAASPERCVHQLFEEQAARTPHAEALVCAGKALSYAQLNARANRLAHHLIALGVRPDSRVAIALPRGIDMVVALLATLKAGGAYVPLDPEYPAERLGYMLDDCTARWVLTDTAVQARLPASRALLTATVLELDAPHAPWDGCPDTNPDPAVLRLTPSHLAYVIYTSGSTGMPKGVMAAHAGLCNLAHAQIEGFGVTPASRVLQFASFSFDACISEVLMTLCSGATLYVPAPGVLAGSTLHNVLRDGHITHATLPPAVLAAMPDDAVLPELQTLVMAGETASHALVQRWATGRRLINAYGPTEATVCASMHPCEAQHPGPPPIGAPIANTRIYIVDAHGQPSPVGVAGEIHIAGIQMARGYLRRPELTAERFVPNPFGEPGSRMYKTGDVGRWRPDGSIEFLGRNDHQVKVRGFRIELGEIEAALRSHPEVRAAAVLAREDAPGDKRLVAYIVSSAAPEALRQHLGSRLPDFMVPAAYVPLDALPLTPNGKLDRKALPPPHEPAVRPSQYEPPRMGVEQVLAKAWARVLNVAFIGREDHFFELGGHSLMAVRLVSEATQLGLSLTLQDVYAHPTLRAQAERLLGEEHTSSTSILAVRRTGTARPLFALPTGIEDVTYAFALAAHVDADVPVYAIPWPEVMPESMDDLAVDMVQLMRTIQPAGPYRLLGYSSGALLAYAIAQRLAEYDEPVDFIGMLDCEHHTKEHNPESPEATARHHFLFELTKLIEEQTFGEQEDVRQALRQLVDDLPRTPLDELIDRYEHHDVLSALARKQHTSVRQIATTYLRIAQFHKLWPSYAARPLPAPWKLHAFYATEDTAPAHPMGWQQLLPLDQIVVVPVPGTHMSLIEPPHIGHVGHEVSEALRQSRPASTS
jgi:amino acid adenylation domain-containing protein